MVLSSVDVFKQEYEKVFGKKIPENVIIVDHLKYQRGRIRYDLYVQFIVTLKTNFHSHDTKTLRWNDNNGLSKVIVYEQLYNFYSDDDSSLINDMKSHIEQIQNSLEKNINNVESVYGFFRMNS